MQRTGVLVATTLTVIVTGFPLTILLVLDPSASQASCESGGSPTGPGPAKVPGIPERFLPIFEAASQLFALGGDGWAYLAALNYAESEFGTDNGAGTGVLSGSNYAGAAGPMQIGIGGAAGDGWDEYKSQIPPNLPGGAEPPDVHNEVDAVYAGAAILRAGGAPGDWLAALKSWNDYPPEITEVTQLVAQYTQAAVGHGGAPEASGATPVTANDAVTPGGPTTPAPSGGCATAVGPTIPGTVAKIQSNGLAAIPQDAPPQVQAALAAGNQIIHYPYSYAGGHSPAAMKIPPGPNAFPGEQENGGPGYDCSGSTSFVLWGAGLGQSLLGGETPASGSMQTDGLPGAGKWITIYANPGHVFIEVAGIVMDTAWYAPVQPTTPGTGPRWQPASIIQPQIRGDEYGWFDVRHPAGL